MKNTTYQKCDNTMHNSKEFMHKVLKNTAKKQIIQNTHAKNINQKKN